MAIIWCSNNIKLYILLIMLFLGEKKQEIGEDLKLPNYTDKDKDASFTVINMDSAFVESV